MYQQWLLRTLVLSQSSEFWFSVKALSFDSPLKQLLLVSQYQHFRILKIDKREQSKEKEENLLKWQKIAENPHSKINKKKSLGKHQTNFLILLNTLKQNLAVYHLFLLHIGHTVAFQEINFFRILQDLLDLSIAPESRTCFSPTKSIPPYSYRGYMTDHIPTQKLSLMKTQTTDDTSTSQCEPNKMSSAGSVT